MLQTIHPVAWTPADPENSLPGRLRLLDQTALPAEERYIETDDLEEVRDAIRRLVVRGAPAIGCAAAYGLAAAMQHSQAPSPRRFYQDAVQAGRRLKTARPTAVNLEWAVNRCLNQLERRLDQRPDVPVPDLKRVLFDEANRIFEEDLQLCRAIGDHGLALFQNRRGVRVLTHCNAGALATSGFGTALAPIYRAQEAGLAPQVFADETRPLLQGARLTTWELLRAGVAVTLICDDMAAKVMGEGRIDLVIVGADRIAANGDVANKIGTYGAAVLARHHGIPFYVAAPYSTIDIHIETGSDIPIEERDPEEIRCGFGRPTAPADCPVYNPAFDVTPADLITGIITEHGILRPPYGPAIRTFMQRRSPQNAADA